jgi:hypothetical protein
LTLIKKKTKFSSYSILGNLEGSGAESYLINYLLIYRVRTIN